MKQLFLAVSAQLATVPAIKWIDMEKGQTDNAELRVALKFPSALIKISFPNPEELGGGNQQVKATVQVRLVFDAVNSRTSKNTPDTRLIARLSTCLPPMMFIWHCKPTKRPLTSDLSAHRRNRKTEVTDWPLSASHSPPSLATTEGHKKAPEQICSGAFFMILFLTSYYNYKVIRYIYCISQMSKCLLY